MTSRLKVRSAEQITVKIKSKTFHLLKVNHTHYTYVRLIHKATGRLYEPSLRAVYVRVHF